MKTNLLFYAMFQAMDCLYHEEPDEVLGDFLSEANPYLFAGRNSADPAVKPEFDQFVRKESKGAQELTAEESYRIVLQYLRVNTDFSERFLDISLGEWSDLCDIIEKEESYKGEAL